MKKLTPIIICIMLSGCATFDGVKQDSKAGWNKTKEVANKAWTSSKEAIHSATK